jgi:glycerol-3-phosphate dehydrogenase
VSRLREFDVLVIGGGVNGAGIARDLAGRGLSVLLVEKDDLASATSSASTKLIHGGLRYLEHYEFRLVREALKEREVLLKSAPHLISPLTFILPHHKKLRPWWLIRLGLFLYDHLGGPQSVPRSKGHHLPGTNYGQPLKPEFRRGFSYSDCWADDTRLVTLIARDAADKGAEIRTRTECIEMSRHEERGMWQATMQDHNEGGKYRVLARMIVNASGPWVGKTLGLVKEDIARHRVRWVKGSHIIVPRLYQGDHAYILQNDDGRVVFLIPYEKKYTLIGTTDVDYREDIEEVRITMEEVDYLCKAANRFLRHAVKPADIQWTYSGVRPLVDDGDANPAAVTRDYILDPQEWQDLPILSVFGGKLTTFRKLSETVGDAVVGRLGRGGPAWTESAPLPGADPTVVNFQTFLKTLKREYNWLPEALSARFARSYGARTRDILRGAKRLSDLGEYLGENVYEAEIRYLVEQEWAQTLEDVLWRRSKLGLHLLEDTQKKIKKLLKKIQAKRESA